MLRLITDTPLESAMRKTIFMLALAACLGSALVPGPALCFECASDTELSEVRGSDGSVLGLFSGEVLGEEGLSEAEARSKWAGMSEEERNAARKHFRQSLLNMSPEERQAVRQKMLDRFQALSPKEQEDIRSRMGERLRLTTPAERREFESFRKSMGGPGPGRGPGGR